MRTKDVDYLYHNLYRPSEVSINIIEKLKEKGMAGVKAQSVKSGKAKENKSKSRDEL